MKRNPEKALLRLAECQLIRRIFRLPEYAQRRRDSVMSASQPEDLRFFDLCSSSLRLLSLRCVTSSLTLHLCHDPLFLPLLLQPHAGPVDG